MLTELWQRKSEVLSKCLPQFHFPHHRSHTNGPGKPKFRYETGNLPRDLQDGVSLAYITCKEAIWAYDIGECCAEINVLCRSVPRVGFTVGVTSNLISVGNYILDRQHCVGKHCTFRNRKLTYDFGSSTSLMSVTCMLINLNTQLLK